MPNTLWVNHEFSSSLASACEFTWCHFSADKWAAWLEPTLVWDASSTGVSWLIWWEISSFWLSGQWHQHCRLVSASFSWHSLCDYWASELLLSPLCCWLSGGLIGSSFLFLCPISWHIAFPYNLSPQIRGKEEQQSGLIFQGKGWLPLKLKFFPSFLGSRSLHSPQFLVSAAHWKD